MTKIDDLIVLQYCDNACYVEVVDIKDVKEKKFLVNLHYNTWSGEYPEGDVYTFKKTYKIGEARYTDRCQRYGVIGVFNRLDTKQLSHMMFVAKDAVSDNSYSED